MPRIVSHKGAWVVELPDRLSAGPDRREAALETLLEAGRRSVRLIVDLSRVRHVEGELISVLVRAWKRLAARPGDIVIVAEGLQREVLEIVKLDKIFVLVGSRDEAVSAPWPEPVPAVRTVPGRAAG